VALIAAVVVVLTILAAFAIKSSIVQEQPLSKSHRQSDDRPQSNNRSLQIMVITSAALSDNSVEMGNHDGTTTRNLSREAEMQKVKTLEIFKVSHRFSVLSMLTWCTL